MNQTFKGCDTPEPVQFDANEGTIIVFTTPAPDKHTGNEDAVGFWEIGTRVCVLAVADGLGGLPGGAEAAGIAIDAVGRAIERADGKGSLRSEILDAFEDANARLLDQGIGSGTTLVVVEVKDADARAYHAGDSGALMVGQRGRVRFETMPHSPVGYAVASGMLEHDDVHDHDERHLLSNCIGSREMRVEIGAPTPMAPRDTLILATDGVFDNIQRGDLIDMIRVGPLESSAARLKAKVRETMLGRHGELPARPDDATALLFRIARP